jgi:hypothetical protein
MVVKGCVRNSVVVLDNGVRLPEGQEVTVLVPGTVSAVSRPHSVLDIPTISAGAVLRPLTPDDDVLGEMLDNRP